MEPLTIENATWVEPVVADGSGALAMLKSELRSAITDMREQNTGQLRCRALSEAITCAETSYLWLCQVQGESGLLAF